MRKLFNWSPPLLSLFLQLDGEKAAGETANDIDAITVATEVRKTARGRRGEDVRKTWELESPTLRKYSQPVIYTVLSALYF